MAPSAAASARMADAAAFKPKPAMHIAGTNDELVKYAWQEMAMNRVKQINQCEAEGKPWAKDCTLFPSKVGAPFVAFHPSRHSQVPGRGSGADREILQGAGGGGEVGRVFQLVSC
jgi:polyhydroxybutyrate depolymerase